MTTGLSPARTSPAMLSPGFRSLRPGVHLADGGALFTIFSREADRVWLMLFDRPDAGRPDREIVLTPEDHRMGDFWHVFVEGVKPGQLYLYRMAGGGGALDPGQWLLDPYALAVDADRRWGETRHLEPGRWPRSGAGFPKGVIVDLRYNWGDDRRPGIPLNDTILYEAHLRGYTAHESSGVAAPGTYRGFEARIPYLKDLGVTAVEFLPIQEFNEMELYLENERRRALRNFWGYSTMAYSAPMSRYAAATGPGAAVREFRDLVRALHAAGIEVILDVVFNHTGEWDERGPVFAFKGIGRPVYYILTPDGRGYANFTGCGNTLSANHPVVQEMILDGLRHWTAEMHVDGFRFDLASALTRGPDGRVMDRPPVIERIAEDPLLRRVKLFAEAWDASGLYQVGRFPHVRWSEWNGLYRDDMRRFWLGHGGRLGPFATRLAGSSDLYARDGQTPLKSVNFITSHDGFTLADLVRYNQPHNEDNGEEGRDGERNNFSFNFGFEGPSADPEIEAVRRRMQKNLLATLLVSRGVPMLLAGDEFGRTQRGNNNGYCQDNAISWVDWSLREANAELHAFARELIRFRRRHTALRRGRFFTGQPLAGGPPDIEWLGPEGQPPDWERGRALGCVISGDRRHLGTERDEESILLLFNGGADPARFVLPPRDAGPWRLAWSSATPVVDTGNPPAVTCESRSVAALTAPPPARP